MAKSGWLRLKTLTAKEDGLWEDANQALDEALSISRAAPYPYSEAQTLEAHAILLAAQHDVNRAIDTFGASLAVFERLGARPEADRVKHNLQALQDRLFSEGAV